MRRYQIGEFEEVVLLIVGVLYDNAYGVAIKDEIEGRLKRKVSVGAMQSALRRLENKGFLESRVGEVTPNRGGKAKRYFTLTSFGREAIEYNKDMRNQLWDDLNKVIVDFKFT